MGEDSSIEVYMYMFVAVERCPSCSIWGEDSSIEVYMFVVVERCLSCNIWGRIRVLRFICL